jgi:selenocysteine lyase/cysteine desulfurase
VRFDVRASGLRLSPHIYNTDQEIDAVLDCLRG